jgi:hypothetical protein
MLLCLHTVDPMRVHGLGDFLEYCYIEGVCSTDSEETLLVFCQRNSGYADLKEAEELAMEPYERDDALAEALDQALSDLEDVTKMHTDVSRAHSEAVSDLREVEDDHRDVTTKLNHMKLQLVNEMNARQDAESDLQKSQEDISDAWFTIRFLIGGLILVILIASAAVYKFKTAAKPKVVLVTSTSGRQDTLEVAEEAPTVVMGRTITNEKGAAALDGSVAAA